MWCDAMDVRGKRVLVVGIGGGADIISAYAFASLLDVGEEGCLVVANTKRRDESDLIHLTPQIAHLPPRDPAAETNRRHGTTGLDRMVPQGDLHSPWIFLLPKDKAASATLAEEIASFGFDVIFGVDTGGDVLKGLGGRKGGGRDGQMMRLLQTLDVPSWIVVVGLGADGETRVPLLQTVLNELQDELLGPFSLAPLYPIFEQFRERLQATRTPNIILAAAVLAEAGAAEMLVGRCQKPTVPIAWLTSAYLFPLTAA